MLGEWPNQARSEKNRRVDLPSKGHLEVQRLEKGVLLLTLYKIHRAKHT